MHAENRWTHLANAAFRLGEASGKEDRLKSALEVIDSATEVFPPSIDPVDDLEGYAVRRMLLAFRDLLR